MKFKLLLATVIFLSAYNGVFAQDGGQAVAQTGSSDPVLEASISKLYEAELMTLHFEAWQGFGYGYEGNFYPIRLGISVDLLSALADKPYMHKRFSDISGALAASSVMTIGGGAMYGVGGSLAVMAGLLELLTFDFDDPELDVLGTAGLIVGITGLAIGIAGLIISGSARNDSYGVVAEFNRYVAEGNPRLRDFVRNEMISIEPDISSGIALKYRDGVYPLAGKHDVFLQEISSDPSTQSMFRDSFATLDTTRTLTWIGAGMAGAGVLINLIAPSLGTVAPVVAVGGLGLYFVSSLINGSATATLINTIDLFNRNAAQSAR